MQNCHEASVGTEIYSLSRDYNFGHPSFPWTNGRDFAGIVVQIGKSVSRVKLGDVVRYFSTGL